MATVYGNCRIMISALGSTSSHSGIFRDRQETRLFTFRQTFLEKFEHADDTYAHVKRIELAEAIEYGALSVVAGPCKGLFLHLLFSTIPQHRFSGNVAPCISLKTLIMRK
jgi:hypothetical protein